MLRQIKPRNARSKRALDKKEAKPIENPKTSLLLRGTTASAVVQNALTDLNSLRQPHSKKFTKKNDIHPFEDAASLEFFSEKNDASLVLFGAHSKKRPHCLSFVRMFDHKVLDMLELYIDPETFKTLAQFKNRKCAVGLRPMICFAGTPFESPTPTPYTLARSLLLDFFGGLEMASVDVEGLQYMICVSAGEEGESELGPKIHLRVYLIRTKRSGQKVPRIDVEEMGPRIDFRVGRLRQAEESIMKEALKRPKNLEPKSKKNIETDIVGDKMGRIHLGRQNLDLLQTRKMKGLKRERDVNVEEPEEMEIDDEDDESEGGVPVKKIKA